MAIQSLSMNGASPPPAAAPTIVLTGMRGIGKSTLGLIAATHLNRPFVDCDRALAKYAKCSPNEYIQRHSWEQFRDLEAEILRNILTTHPTGWIVACGGGVVERQENRELLRHFGKQGGIVIHVIREKEAVIRYLVNEKDRPQWGEEIRSVWARRYPLFSQCSTHTYASLTANAHSERASPRPLALKGVEQDWVRFLSLISHHEPAPLPPPTRRSYSIAISAAVPHSIDRSIFDIATSGVDLIGLQVDSIRRPVDLHRSPASTPTGNPGKTELDDIAFAVAYIRRLSKLPISFVIKTVMSGGSFVLDETTADDYVDLARMAFKTGVEYLEIEITVGEQIIRKIAETKPRNVRLVLSYLDASHSLGWDGPEVRSLYDEAVRAGADLVKIGLSPDSRDCDAGERHLLTQLQASQQYGSRIPLIACDLGRQVRPASLLNTLFTPVTHPLLTDRSSGHLPTFVDVQHALFAAGLVKVATIAVSQGQDQASQRSAQIVGSGCRILGLPYEVEPLADSQIIEYGIASQALPESGKEALCTAAAVWTQHVDLVLANGSGAGKRFHNVRSLAIADVIRDNLSPINALSESTPALLIGARGKEGREAACALLTLGIKHVLCYNCDSTIRDPALQHIDNLSLACSRPPAVIILSSSNLGPSLSVPSGLLWSPTGGTILECSRNRASIFDAILGRSPQADSWVRVSYRDVDKVCLQKQFQLLTNYRLPSSAFL